MRLSPRQSGHAYPECGSTPGLRPSDAVRRWCAMVVSAPVMADATMLVLPVPFLQHPPGRPPGCPKAELMSKPTILTVDDDSQVSAAISKTLSSKTLCPALLLRFSASTAARVSRRGWKQLQAASPPGLAPRWSPSSVPCWEVLDCPVDRLESGWRHARSSQPMRGKQHTPLMALGPAWNTSSHCRTVAAR